MPNNLLTKVILGMGKFQYKNNGEQIFFNHVKKILEKITHISWLVFNFIMFGIFFYWFLFGICPLMRDNIRKTNQTDFSEYENKLLSSIEESEHQLIGKTENNNELSNIDNSNSNSYSL